MSDKPAHQAMNALNAFGEPVRAVLPRIPDGIANSAGYERQARHHIEASIWEHIQGGADQGLTLAHNRHAFDRLQLLPQPVADLRGGHTRLKLLGHDFAHPLLLAPVAYQRLVHPEGELASVRAAMALQAGYVCSTLSSYTLEDIAAAAQAAVRELGRGAPLWFQLYAQPERAHTLSLVQRAEAAGYQAIVWTVDAAIKRAGLVLPAGVEAVNLKGFPVARQTSHASQGGIVLGTPLADAAPRWDDLDWLRSQTRLPIVVKGVLSPAQAREAVVRGADALIISNHGGRVIDGVPSPVEVLPAIRSALEPVAPATPLLLDSGVRWGTDAAKALALGASAVFIGRPVLHALAVGGMVGVAHLLHLLRAELELAMAQLGCATLEHLTPDVIWSHPRRD